MISLQFELNNKMFETISYRIVRSATTGFLCGAVYAHFANLPIKQAAIAYAVFYVTIEAFGLIAGVFSLNWKKNSFRSLIVVTHVTTTLLGIHELRKRGLMGDKLLMLNLIFNSLALLYLLKLQGAFPKSGSLKLDTLV